MGGELLPRGQLLLVESSKFGGRFGVVQHDQELCSAAGAEQSDVWRSVVLGRMMRAVGFCIAMLQPCEFTSTDS